MLLALLLAATCPNDAAATTYLRLPGTTLDGVECYKKLETLDAEDRGFSDLAPLRKITTLKKLLLRKNKIIDLSPLAGATALEELDIGENDVASLAPLAGLTKLRVLKAQRNKLADLSPLRAMTELDTLIVYDNRLTDVSPLLGAKKLRNIDFERNAITNLMILRPNDVPVSEISKQYKGSCIGLTARFAICPPWEDAQVKLAVVPPGCRVERLCNGIAGIDCHSAADGAYDYFELATQRMIARCGGRCISGEGCKNCPPKQMAACPAH